MVLEGEKRQETLAGKFAQLKVTAPAKFMGVICTVTGDEKELLTMLTEAGDGLPIEKPGGGTLRVRGRVWMAEAPFKFPVAVTVRAELPEAVLAGTDTVTEAGAGKGPVTFAGAKLHAPPAGRPAVHVRLTFAGSLKFELAEMFVVAAFETLPVPMVTVPGEKAEAANCTTCNASDCVLVTGPGPTVEAADKVTL